MSYTCLIQCVGGPLDGEVIEVECQYPAPDRQVILPLPGGGEITYWRVPRYKTVYPGDTWEYVPYNP